MKRKGTPYFSRGPPAFGSEVAIRHLQRRAVLRCGPLLACRLLLGDHSVECGLDDHNVCRGPRQLDDGAPALETNHLLVDGRVLGSEPETGMEAFKRRLNPPKARAGECGPLLYGC